MSIKDGAPANPTRRSDSGMMRLKVAVPTPPEETQP
jgi:hypothetical protein